MKTSLFYCCFFAGVLLNAGCSSNEHETMNVASDHTELVHNYFETFNQHEWDELAAFYAEPAEFKDPSLGQEVVKQTREETSNKYRELAEMFPDLKDEILQIYPSGKKHVIVEFISSGTGEAGQKWSLPICTIFTIENGMITKDYTYYDNF